MLRSLEPGKIQEKRTGPLRGQQDGEISMTQQIYMEFWTRFWEEVVRWDSDLPPQKPMLQGWVTFPIGRDGFYLIAFLSANHKLAGMGLVMDGPESNSYYNLLLDEKETIEQEMGSKLDWRELPEKDESHIYLHRRGVDPHDRQMWGDYMAWFASQLEAFTVVFGPRIRELDTGDYRSMEAIFR
jgi:hypothetical protein